MIDLKYSDLMSGVLCYAYDWITKKQTNAVERVAEQVVYNSVGRAINTSSSLPSLNVSMIKEDVWYVSGVAVLDSTLRSKQSTTSALYDGLRAGAASIAADFIMLKANVEDKVLFSL